MAFIFIPPGSTFSDLSAARVRGFPFASVATIARNETAYQISDRPISVASLRQVSGIYKIVLAVPVANAPGVMTGARVISISDQAAMAAAARNSVFYLMDDVPVILSAAGVTSFGASTTLPPGNVAPALVTPGAITPASGPVGTVFTITPPVFSGSPTPTVTRTVTLAGSPITVTGNSYTSTSAGALAAAWSASNGVGSPATSTASATVTEAPVVPSGLTVVSMPQVEPSAARVGGVSTLVDPVVTGGTPPYTYVRALRAGGSGVTNGQNLFGSAAGDPPAIEWPSSANGVNAPYNAYYNVVVNDAAGATTGRLTANATVAAADAGGADLSAAAIYIPDTSDPAANLTLPLVAQGRLAASFAATAGGGALQSSPRGIEFDGTNGLVLNDVDISSGYYMVGIATWDGLVGAQTTPVFANLRTAAGQVMQIRRSGSSLQANWNYGTATNNDGGAMPALTIGTPVVFGVEVDPVAGTVRTWNGTAFASKALNASGALETSILRLGRDQAATNFLDGAIKDFTFEPLGASQAVTFEQALAELGAEVALPFP